MKIDELDYAEVGRRLVNLVTAASRAGHKRVKSSADHDVIPREDDLEGQFVVEAFTKTLEEIEEKWFDGEHQ